MRKQRETPKRNRTEQIKFWATPEEKDLILKKMELYGTSNMGAYLRKMAIAGYVIKLELPELKEMIRLLGIANNNINQIARSLNSTGRIYEADPSQTTWNPSERFVFAMWDLAKRKGW